MEALMEIYGIIWKYGGFNGNILYGIRWKGNMEAIMELYGIRWKYGVFNETYMGYMEIIEQLGTMMKYGS